MLDAVEAIPKEKGDVKDEAVRLMRSTCRPAGRGVAAARLPLRQYLGGSIASALTNMTQPILMSFPYLRSGARGARAAELTMRAMIAGGRQEGRPDPSSPRRCARLKDGVIAPQEIHQLQAEAIRSFGSNIYLRRFSRCGARCSAWPSNSTAGSTFIAAYACAAERGRTRSRSPRTR
jgi:hypothetical protein